MKKIKMLALGLMFSLGSINTQAADCGGMLVPLDELKYMDDNELQWNLCRVPGFLDLYMQMMNTEEMSACAKLTSLGSKVLKREHGQEPYSAEKCKEEYPHVDQPTL